jgi:FtsH-binding integral membrane protein
MNVITQIAAGLFAITLIVVGILEIRFYGDQRFRPIFYVDPGTEGAVRMWAQNIGAVNIVTAAGLAAGLWMANSGQDALHGAGVGIVLYALAANLLLGPWLWITERRLWGSAIGQAALPLVGLVAFAVAG